jgi:hypothetical protein
VVDGFARSEIVRCAGPLERAIPRRPECVRLLLLQALRTGGNAHAPSPTGRPRGSFLLGPPVTSAAVCAFFAPSRYRVPSKRGTISVHTLAVDDRLGDKKPSESIASHRMGRRRRMMRTAARVASPRSSAAPCERLIRRRSRRRYRTALQEPPAHCAPSPDQSSLGKTCVQPGFIDRLPMRFPIITRSRVDEQARRR